MNSENMQQDHRQSLLGPRELLKSSWQICKAQFRVFLGILVPLFAVAGVGALITFMPVSSTTSLLTGLMNLVATIVSIWVTVSLLYAVKERDHGIGVKEALTLGRRKLVAYWWVSVLSMIIVMGGFFLLVIPGFILAVWFSLATYVVIVEGRSGVSALLRSKQLVEGYWWPVVGRFLAMAVVVLLVSLPVIALLGAGGAVGTLVFKLTEAQLNQLAAVLDFITLPLQGLISAFAITYGLLLYGDVKRVKGDPPFENPSNRRKLKYLAVGGAGLLILISLFVGIIII